MDYEDNEEVEFIFCNICNAKIRGETHYKIHLTESQHLKKEDLLVAVGKARRSDPLPKWNSLCQYLDFLQLDEPIIGLQHLVEIDSDGSGPKYLCRLCFAEGDLPGITTHVLSRKHRKKYLVTKRPDLVTWDINNAIQLGKLVRAKAEVAERQDGRGIPEEKKRRLRPLMPELVNMRGSMRDSHRAAEMLPPHRRVYQGSLRPEEASGFDRWQIRKEERAFARASVGNDGYNRGFANEDLHRRDYREEGYNEQGYPDDVPHGRRYRDRSPYRQHWTEPEPRAQGFAGHYSLQRNCLEEEPPYEESYARERPFPLNADWDMRHDGEDGRRQKYAEPWEHEDEVAKARQRQLLQILRSHNQDRRREDVNVGHPGNRGSRNDLPGRSSPRFSYGTGMGQRMPFEAKERRDIGLYDTDDRETTFQHDKLQYGGTRRLVYQTEFGARHEDRPPREDDFPRKRMRMHPDAQTQDRSFRDPPEGRARWPDRRHPEDNPGPTRSQQGYYRDLSRGPAFDTVRFKNSSPSHLRSTSHPEDAWVYPGRLEDSTPDRPGFRRPASPPHGRPQFRVQHEYEPPQSSSLDKITSTLLQLVARKGSL